MCIFYLKCCSLRFGSWTYDGFNLDLDFYDNLETVEITNYIADNNWKLVEYPAKKNIK